MNDERLEKFISFTPKTLKYYGRSGEPYDDPKSFVVRKANFFPNLGQKLTVLLHQWDMRALYHTLECYEFLYVYKGEFLIYLEDRATQLHEGDLCIIPPGVLQKNTENTEVQHEVPPVMLKFFVPPDDIHHALNYVFFVDSPVKDYLSDTMTKNSYPCIFVMRNQTEYGKDIAGLTVTEILRSLDTKRQNSCAACSLLSALIFSYIDSENVVYEPSKMYYENSDTVSVMVEYICANLNSITLDELCEKFHYTPSYICRMIKDRTGMTFKELLNYKRLAFAAQELIRTDDPIKQVASVSGYQSIEYFFRIFKKRYGVTPNEYRNIVRNEEKYQG